MERVPMSSWLFIIIPSIITYICAIKYYLGEDKD